MTRFLDDLGRELDGAAARVAVGRRPRAPRLAIVSLATAAAVAAALVVVFAGGPDRAGERSVVAGPRSAPVSVVPGPPAVLDGVPVDVIGTGAYQPEALSMRGALEDAGWPVTAPRLDVPRRVDPAFDGLAVVVGTADPAQATAVAERLDVALVQPATANAFPELRDRPLTIVVGAEWILPAAVDAYRQRFAVLDAGGKGTTRARTARGPVRLFVRGAELCVFDPGGGGCSSYRDSVAGENITTVETEDGSVLSARGAVPDGIDHVTIDGERIAVVDNVWATGRVVRRAVDIPTLGSRSF